MLKNLILYRIDGDLPDLQAAADAMQARAFVPCGPTQPAAAGWVSPRSEGGPMLEIIGGQLIAKMMTETRVVPAAAVKRATDEELDRLEEQTGRRPRGKAAREIKEQVYHSLLPRAFSRFASMLVWIDAHARVMAVEATSAVKADVAVMTLIEAAPGVRVSFLQTARAPGSCMSEWLASQEAPAGFTIDRECELKQPDGEKQTVRYARHTLDIDEVVEHIRQGKLPTKVAMTWNSRVSFLMTDAMLLKRIEILDVAVDKGGDEAVDAFDADVAISTGKLRGMIAALVDAMGGLYEAPTPTKEA